MERNDCDFDNSSDILQKSPRKKSFLSSQSMDLPNSPSPRCSPLNQHDEDTADASFSFCFSFLPQSEPGEEVAGSTRTTITDENGGVQSTFYDPSKSASAMCVNPRRALPPKPYKEEIYPQPRIQQGHSVRRANLPRRYCQSEPQIILREEIRDKVPVSSEIEVVQPDKAKDQDSNASNASKNAVKDTENSSEGFESSNPVENFHLTATKEEENLRKNDTSIQVLSGVNGSSSKPTNEETHADDQNVQERIGHTANIQRRSAFISEIEADTAAMQAATRERYRIRLQREEEKIRAWEMEQITKANERMRKLEIKLQQKRAEALWKTQKKITRAHIEAENRKVANRKRFDAQSVGEPSLANKTRVVFRRAAMELGIGHCFLCFR